jgi:hypothetical protein
MMPMDEFGGTGLQIDPGRSSKSVPTCPLLSFQDSVLLEISDEITDQSLNETFQVIGVGKIG